MQKNRLSISSSIKNLKYHLILAISCMGIILSLTLAFADGSIYSDSSELSNSLNTPFNDSIVSSSNGAGEVVARYGNSTYRPAVIKISDQQLYMWFCLGDGYGDEIYFASSTNSGQSWISTTEVMRSCLLEMTI